MISILKENFIHMAQLLVNLKVRSPTYTSVYCSLIFTSIIKRKFAPKEVCREAIFNISIYLIEI